MLDSCLNIVNRRNGLSPLRPRGLSPTTLSRFDDGASAEPRAHDHYRVRDRQSDFAKALARLLLYWAHVISIGARIEKKQVVLRRKNCEAFRDAPTLQTVGYSGTCPTPKPAKCPIFNTIISAPELPA